MDESIRRQLVEFITKRRSEGAGDLAIQDELKTAGWETWMITNGFAAVGTTVKTGEARILTQAVEGEGVESSLIEVADVGVMALMAQAWEYFKGRWKTLVGIYLLLYAAWFVVGGVVGLMVFFVVLPVYSGQFIQQPNWTNSIYVLLGILFLILIGVTLSMVGQLALYFGISNKHQGIGVIGAYKKAWGKLGSWWVMMMLAGMAIYGGILLFAIPGILASMWFTMAVFVLVDEDLGGMSGLTKSKFYMKNNILLVIGRMAVVGLLLVVVNVVVEILGWIVGRTVGGGVGNLLSGLGGVAISLASTPYVLVVQYLLFQAIKAKKRGESYDLAQGRSAIVGLIIWGIVATVLMTAIIVAVGMRSIRSIQGGESGYGNPYRLDFNEVQEFQPSQELKVD